MAGPEKHALAGASNSERWINCPPSLRLTENMPEKTSKYAEEGTLAHALAELKVRKHFTVGKPSEWKKEHDKIKKHELYQEEMEWCTDLYREHIESIALKFPSKPYIATEQMVDFSDIVPQGFGTADCLVLTPTTLDIIDYKHGKGVQVDVVDNSQLKLYAYGAFRRYQMLYPNIETVTLNIVQPRNGGATSWSLTLTELREWMLGTVKPAAELALEGKGDYKNGDWCRFCKASATCRARADSNLAITEFEKFKQMPPLLTDEEMGRVLTMLEDVVAYQKKVKAYVEEQLLQGKPIEGWKLVAGRGSREWDDQLIAFADITKNGVEEAMLYERKPLTVAALETQLGKKKFAELAGDHVVKKEGKPAVVPEADKRPAWNGATADFKNMIQEEEGSE